MAQTVKNLPAMRETPVILGSGRFSGEGTGYPLRYSAWEIPWTEEPAGYSPWGHKESDTTERLTFHFHFPPFNIYRHDDPMPGSRAFCLLRLFVLTTVNVQNIKSTSQTENLFQLGINSENAF